MFSPSSTGWLLTSCFNILIRFGSSKTYDIDTYVKGKASKQLEDVEREDQDTEDVTRDFDLETAVETRSTVK